MDIPTYRPMAVHPGYLGAQAARTANDSPANRTYSTIHGIALIPIYGLLTQYQGDEGTGYDWIKANFLEALADKHVAAIGFVIDSGGGDVAGCFDLSDLIYSARGIKPTLAICAESAYSAAYAIASACEQVTLPRTGGVGSVGVIAVHMDISGSLEKKGIAVTLVHHGDKKTDGTEVRPLDPGAHARMQSDVNAMGELFVTTVARNRGMTAERVRATQAGTFMGQAGVAVGFADVVLSPDDAFIELAALTEVV
jgi:ClpP class serine protease